MGQEERACKRLHDYWDSLRGERKFPRESEIDPEKIGDIWPSCFLISIDDVTRRLGYRYSYLGDQLVEAYGDDVKNPDVALRLISTANSPMAEKFDEVVAERQPAIDDSEFVNLKNMRIKYRSCMLPLGRDGVNVSHILGCMRWRVY